MKRNSYSLIVLLLMVVLIVTGCSSERRASGKSCGCGVHKGYVGY